MVKLFPRLLLAFSALVLTTGSFMHASAFNKILSALTATDLAPFAANSLKVLWLADSATSLILAIVFGINAVCPFITARRVIVLLALIPMATAVLIYFFIGSFIGGHIQLTAAVAAILGVLQYPPSSPDIRGPTRG